MQDLSNITTLDLVIVALYLLGMLGIGVYFVRRIQNAGDYYVAGRSLALWFWRERYVQRLSAEAR